jgi:hypothetical protein
MNGHPRLGPISEIELAAARADIAAQLGDTVAVPVTFEVTDLRRLHGTGRLLALASVSVDLDGVAVVLHGVQVLRLPTGRLQCRAPHYRNPTTGEWLPAVTLPDALELAIGAEVLALVSEP